MTASDPHDLLRFVVAQAPIYDHALAELTAGQKRSHWMWFVFPQLKGLGRSPMALRYGIGSLQEASAYLAHPLLGPRLVTCTEAVLRHTGHSLHAIFGSPDDVKFCSSLTLFAHAAASGENVFRHALSEFCGAEDERTMAILWESQAKQAAKLVDTAPCQIPLQRPSSPAWPSCSQVWSKA